MASNSQVCNLPLQSISLSAHERPDTGFLTALRSTYSPSKFDFRETGAFILFGFHVGGSPVEKYDGTLLSLKTPPFSLCAPLCTPALKLLPVPRNVFLL